MYRSDKPGHRKTSRAKLLYLDLLPGGLRLNSKSLAEKPSKQIALKEDLFRQREEESSQ